MNWFLLLVSFSLAIFMGAAASALFVMLKPQWNDRNRLLASASLLPGLALLATLALVLAIHFGGPDENGMKDLAIAAIARLGGLVALLALVGGLVGAALQQMGRRR